MSLESNATWIGLYKWYESFPIAAFAWPATVRPVDVPMMSFWIRWFHQSAIYNAPKESNAKPNGALVWLGAEPGTPALPSIVIPVEFQRSGTGRSIRRK